MASLIVSGMCALARRWATSYKASKATSSSKQGLKCSYLLPHIPPLSPRLVCRNVVAKMSLSKSTCWAGAKASRSSGKRSAARCGRSCGLVSSSSVAWVPGAIPVE
eukprot:7738309-Pyramimonas_sp.AAC.1